MSSITVLPPEVVRHCLSMIPTTKQVHARAACSEFFEHTETLAKTKLSLKRTREASSRSTKTQKQSHWMKYMETTHSSCGSCGGLTPKENVCSVDTCREAICKPCREALDTLSSMGMSKRGDPCRCTLCSKWSCASHVSKNKCVSCGLRRVCVNCTDDWTECERCDDGPMCGECSPIAGKCEFCLVALRHVS